MLAQYGTILPQRRLLLPSYQRYRHWAKEWVLRSVIQIYPQMESREGDCDAIRSDSGIEQI